MEPYALAAAVALIVGVVAFFVGRGLERSRQE